jgi:DNA polymerase-3 subunit chi
MTNIDFYILSDTAIAAREQFVCRLVEKAMKLNHRIFVAVDDRDHAETLSDHLWRFKPESFVAHAIQTDNQEDSPVLLGWQADDSHHDVMINLQSQVPDHFSRFQRLTEVVVQDPAILSLTRVHFQFYRHRGYPLKCPQIDN